MSRDELKDKLIRLVHPLLEERGLELVRLDYNAGRKGHLCVYIDKPGGVTIADCEAVSRDISGLLDAYDPIPQSYILEVSSPGVERSLNRESDFRRYQGEMVKIYTHEPVAGKKYFGAKLLGTGEDFIELLPENGETVRIPLDQIKKAHLWFRP